MDVHKKFIVACFKHGKAQEVREYGATTRELLEMAQWLEEGGREPVAMESTGSYWKPLYNILEMSEMVGYRKSLIKEQSAELNRVQKLLEGANIKLSGTIANIGGS